MIPNRWYAILESSEVKVGKPVGVTRLGEKMVVWRDGSGGVACAAERCAHRGAALSRGKVVEGCIQCPFHGLRFDSTGQCRLIPANGRAAPSPKAFQVRAYPTREAHGFLWIWWGELRPDLPPLPFFEDLERGFRYATFRDRWPVHYTRAVENQLDVSHLPFVHASTIGRGGRTVVDGPLATLEGDEIDVWVQNRVDDGTPARRSGEIASPQRPPMLRFRFPNLWQNRISENVRIFLSFTPIDEGSTMLYLRYYHRFGPVPPLARLFTWAGILSSIVILRQDKRVVVTQRPIETDVAMGEKLIPADRPILLYRSHRRKLLEQEVHGGD